MSFEEFQNRSRLYVIGALEPDEIDEFERARKQFGQKAEDFIGECFDGTRKAAALVGATFLVPHQFSQNKFLQESVEIHLEQTQVAPRSCRRSIVIAELSISEIIFGRNDQTCLIKSIEPGVCVLRWDSQGAVGERFFLPI